MAMMGATVDIKSGNMKEISEKMKHLKAAILLPGKIHSISGLLYRKVKLLGEAWVQKTKEDWVVVLSGREQTQERSRTSTKLISRAYWLRS